MARVVHFEIPVKDPHKASEFYQQALDWKVEKWDGPIEYYLVSTGDEGARGINGGFYTEGEGISGIVNTVDVANLDATLAKVKAAGGTIVSPKSAVPGNGWLAYAKDPDGNLFGMMEYDPNAG